MFSMLSKSVRSEYEGFRLEILKLDKKEIFDAAYKINVFVQLYEYLTYPELDKVIAVKYARCLLEDCGCVLANLYEFFLHNEDAILNNWEDITDMIVSYCEKYYSDVLEEEYEDAEN